MSWWRRAEPVVSCICYIPRHSCVSSCIRPATGFGVRRKFVSMRALQPF
jgi:hypothetical protein